MEKLDYYMYLLKKKNEAFQYAVLSLSLSIGLPFFFLSMEQSLPVVVLVESLSITLTFVEVKDYGDMKKRIENLIKDSNNFDNSLKRTKNVYSPINYKMLQKKKNKTFKLLASGLLFSVAFPLCLLNIPNSLFLIALVESLSIPLTIIEAKEHQDIKEDINRFIKVDDKNKFKNFPKTEEFYHMLKETLKEEKIESKEIKPDKVETFPQVFDSPSEIIYRLMKNNENNPQVNTEKDVKTMVLEKCRDREGNNK